jgi:NAD(P)-dependent dehydrogenase (short-subunit alcohol dehydrogenase family)
MSRYAAAHVSPEGPGDSRPTALQVVEDEGMKGKLKGRVIVITGTSSGLGIETARALYTTGATLFLTARNVRKAKAALANISELGRTEFIEMDLESFASVRAAAKAILEKTDKINILINNAGIMAAPGLEFTKNGHELQFGTNHLSHFLFFQLLKPALLAATTPDFHSRVVNVSSAAHRLNGINATDNYNFEKGGYNPWVSYAQSKTANIYMANEIERRYGSRGLHATSVHPGGIATGLSKHIPKAEIAAMLEDKALVKSLKNPEQGAATTVWAAIGEEWENKGGKYLSNCAEAKRGNDDGDMSGADYASHTYYMESEGRLWEDSLKIVGLTDDQ